MNELPRQNLVKAVAMGRKQLPSSPDSRRWDAACRQHEPRVLWLIAAHKGVFGNLPFKLEEGVFVLGRSVECDITIAENTLSRRHARLTCSEECRHVLVEDLASRNGSFVNGVRVERCDVSLHSALSFGNVDLRLVRDVPRSIGLSEWENESTTYSDVKRARIGHAQPMLRQLTNSQREVCALMLEGLDEPSIAKRLERSIHTVHNHVRKIYAACHVHSREELLTKLLRRL